MISYVVGVGSPITCWSGPLHWIACISSKLVHLMPQKPVGVFMDSVQNSGASWFIFF